MSKSRVDVLEKVPGRREELIGELEPYLNKSSLNKVVATAAAELGAPAAALTFLGRRTQRFIASTGLSADLEYVGATDRSVSFCQFVVRGGEAIEVNDAPNDARVPQAVVEELGVRSYLGVPVQVDGVTLGALCVADVQPRTFSDQQRSALARMAQSVSAELRAAHQLANQRRLCAQNRACAPLFGELRNLLSPVTSGIAHAMSSSAEMQAALRILRVKDPAGRAMVESLLSDTLEAADEVTEILTDLNPATQRLTAAVCALEPFLASATARSPLSSAISDACTAAIHLTKLTGGVRVNSVVPEDDQTVSVRLSVALAAALVARAQQLSTERSNAGVDLTCHAADGVVRVALSSPGWTPAEIAKVIDEVSPLVSEDELQAIPGAEGLLLSAQTDVHPADAFPDDAPGLESTALQLAT